MLNRASLQAYPSWVMPACQNRHPPAPARAESQLCGVDFQCFRIEKCSQGVQIDAYMCLVLPLLSQQTSSGAVRNCVQPGGLPPGLREWPSGQWPREAASLRPGRPGCPKLFSSQKRSSWPLILQRSNPDPAPMLSQPSPSSSWDFPWLPSVFCRSWRPPSTTTGSSWRSTTPGWLPTTSGSSEFVVPIHRSLQSLVLDKRS